MKNLKIYTGYKKNAGLFTISWDGKEDWQCVSIHFFPSKDHWQCGKEEDWHDGPIYSFGLGPLLLICWI